MTSLVCLIAVLFNSSFAFSAVVCKDDEMSSPMQAIYETHEGRRILILKGGFVSENVSIGRARTSDAVGRHIQSRNYDEIWLCSGGGSVREGQAVGNLFNSVRAEVKVPDNYFCASSCTIASLGGYLRTVKENAEFIVHASSSVSELALFDGDGADNLIEITCFTGDESLCNRINSQLRDAGTKGCSEVEVRQRREGCYYFRETYSNAITLTFNLVTLLRSYNQDVLTIYITGWGLLTHYSNFDLVQYYQKMLNDGRTSQSVIRSYESVKTDFDYVHDYNQSSSLRTFSQALALLEASRTDDERLVLLQEMLTQVELSGHQQVLTHLREHESILGRGAKAASNIYEAMITCRIQNSCYLEPHRTAQLGYHNFDHD